MNISKKWLEKHLKNPIDLPDSELREKLSSSLAEVESIEKISSVLENVYVGEIVNIEPLKGSNKAKLVEVNIGIARKRVICGAPNINIGDKVPIVLEGGKVFNAKHDITKNEALIITKQTIYGEISDSMLCSPKELGLCGDHTGILILPKSTEIGADLVTIFQDTIYEIDNKPLTHRSDCFCHLGLAREIAVISKNELKEGEFIHTLIATQSTPFKVKIKDTKLCKRYTSIVIKGVKIKESPLWLQQLLTSIGIRPVNNVVDATNYVMMDIGQPIHAFDYDNVEKGEIIVRKANNNETITTLDGQRRSLTENVLLITDPQKPVGIAGIMGGKNSEITNSTKNIIIECANFDMFNIRKSSMELGLRSDASTRFEKGLDPNQTMSALQQVSSLILDLAEGEIASDIIDIYPAPEEPKEITLELSNVKRLLGIDLSKIDIIEILQSLKLEIINREQTNREVTVKVPTFRRDLNIQEDLIEEIARIYGYNKFEPTLPERDLNIPSRNLLIDFIYDIKSKLSDMGMDELYTYTFVGKNFYEKTLLDSNQLIKIKNPISPELSFIRNSLVPSIIEKVKLNSFNYDDFQIYEIGKVDFKQKDKDNLPVERNMLIGAIYSKDIGKKELIRIVKELTQNLLGQLKFSDFKFQNFKQDTKQEKAYPYLHPGISASIIINGSIKGVIGLIHKRVLNNWEIKSDVALFYLDVDELFKEFSPLVHYKPISKFQDIRKDLSFWISKDKEISEIIEVFNLSLKELQTVKSILVTDVYRDEKNTEEKSITIQITISPIEKTPTDAEVSQILKSLEEIIEIKLKGKIRRE